MLRGISYIKKNLVSKYFDENLSLAEDLIFNLDYLNNCKSLEVVNKCLYFYRREDKQSLSHSNKNSFETSVYLYERLYNYLSGVTEGNIKYDAINSYFFENVIGALISLIASPIDIGIKIKEVKKICENKKLQTAISGIDKLPNRYKYLRLLIKNRMVLSIIITFSFWRMLKHIGPIRVQ